MKDIDIIMKEVPLDNMYFDIWSETQNMNALFKLYSELLTAAKPIAFQSLAMQIGYAAGLHDDPVEAFEYGSKTLLNLRGIGLYEIRKGKGLSIKSNYRLSQKTLDQLNKPDYKWYTPKHNRQGDDVILGRGNNHYGKQAVDVLNILQSINFIIDADILLNFQDSELFETDQFKHIVTNLLGKPFKFEWKYDKRGRCYSTGYDIQLQG
ncbi:MAG: hypothetical protein GY829_08840, partial [Gammaproteobacteria bacterium]|nr:hypothetical protein [Gammaproteobacteria bacterium]